MWNLYKRVNIIAIVLALLALVSFVWSYWIYFKFGHNMPFFASLGHFALNVDSDIAKKSSIYIPATMAAVVTYFSLLLLVFRFFIQKLKQLYMVVFGGHTIVIGLGANNRYFLDSMLKDTRNIIVIEKDESNPHINRFSEQGVVVLIGYIDEFIDRIGIKRAKNILISAGSDDENINIALKIIEYDKVLKNKVKLIIHIEDYILRNLYYGETLLAYVGNFEITTFSYFRDSAIDLFRKHPIDGDSRKIIESDEEFAIAVVGSSNLAINVIAEAIKLAHLPNENTLKIYSISSSAEEFKKLLEFNYPNIDEIKSVKIEYIQKCADTKEFYELDIFKSSKNLTHIIFCDLDQEKNIKYATKLIDTTFREQIVENTLETKIGVALFTKSKLSEKIINLHNAKDKKTKSCKSKDINFIKNLYTFANAKEICHKDNLIDNKNYEIAKIIHKGYGDIYNKCPKIDIEDIDKEWQKASVNDKESSIAQAEHIYLKLKALNLKAVTADDMYYKSLLKNNTNILYSKLQNDRKELAIDDKALEKFSKELEKYYNGEDYEILYFPKEYKLMFEKLLRAEHNRWIAYHKLLGFKKSDVKCKSKKLHNCLKPFKEFNDSEKITIIYDIYSVLYIASYLAYVGKEIKEF